MVADSAAIARASQRRRQRERFQRREGILRGAERAFAERGYLRATMDDVALAAEVSKPTLYSYFSAKDELLLALVLPILVAIGEELQALCERLNNNHHGDGAAFVRDLMRALRRVPTADPERFRLVQLVHQTRLVSVLSESTRAALDTHGRRDFLLARTALAEAMRRGLITKRPVGALADVLWGTVVGILQVQDFKAETQQRDRKRERAATLKMAEQLLVEALLPRMG